ncbi:MAG: TonB-dependent receptor [Balneolaceae bacterium]|nr:TonB-dependent receptor [Balneolaceae bacterium]
MRLFFVTLFLLITGSVYAQIQMDTVLVKEITVEASRIRKPATKQAVSVSEIDSMRIQFLSGGNIANALSAYAPVQLRSNGPGGLATLAQRGYSSSQTQVLWNGFQLNHAMLGLTDLSLIPSFAIQHITVASGNGNTSFGEKGGGTVALQAREVQNSVGFSQLLGSYGTSISETYAGTSVGNWNVSFVGGYEHSENNYAYTSREFSNEAGGFVEVEKKRNNNQLTSKTGILSLHWEEKEKKFSSIIWGHDSSNNIPGGISSLSPEAKQGDSFLRWVNKYQTIISGQPLITKLYVNRQKLEYKNLPADINSKSTTTSMVADIELQSKLHKTLQLISAIQFGQSRVEASSYSGPANRNKFSLQFNPVWEPLKRIHLYSGGRLDYYSDFKEAYSASIGANIEVIKDDIYLKGQLSRNFVAPTFNDLYWPKYGNPDLSAETNLKYEAGILFEHHINRFENSLELSLYDGIVKEGIRWLPGDDGQYRPENLERLRLSGFEIKEEAGFSYRDFHINIRAMLLHTLATLERPRFEGDRATGKQLRYTPEWQVKSNVLLQWKKLSSVLSYNFTEERFSTADHSSPFDPISAYRVANWSTQLNIEKAGFLFTPRFTIQNLFDEDYIIISDYPMPARNYQFKLTIQYSLK